MAGILLHMAALLPVFVTERYRLAAVPGLLLFAAIGLTDAWNSLARHRWWEALIYACIGATGATLVSTPQSNVELWALDEYNIATEALRLDKPDLAAPALMVAYRYSPNNSEINFALGNLQLGRGDMSKAQLCYLRVLELNPNHDGAWNNLGVIAMKNGQWQVAEEYLRRSIAREPDDEGAHYMLAQCQLNQGKRDDALLSIDQALRLSPTREEFLRLREQILQQSEQQQQE
jgi:predicted Zn-dependent protease